jgi:hypothetical protein
MMIILSFNSLINSCRASCSIVLSTFGRFWLFISSPFLSLLFLANDFNLSCSFPALSCEFASVDVSDVLGTVSFYYSIWSSLTNIYLYFWFKKYICYLSLIFYFLISEQAESNKNSSQVFYWFKFKTHGVWVSIRPGYQRH